MTVLRVIGLPIGNKEQSRGQDLGLPIDGAEHTTGLLCRTGRSCIQAPFLLRHLMPAEMRRKATQQRASQRRPRSPRRYVRQTRMRTAAMSAPVGPAARHLCSPMCDRLRRAPDWPWRPPPRFARHCFSPSAPRCQPFFWNKAREPTHSCLALSRPSARARKATRSHAILNPTAAQAPAG